jgi:hypothetical protein
MDGGAPDVLGQEASVEDAPSAFDAAMDASADDARPDADDDSGDGDAGADGDSGSGDSGDSGDAGDAGDARDSASNAAFVGSFAEFGNGSFIGDAEYHADGTASWTGGGFGTWTAFGNTLTARGSNGTGASWTDIVTVSADGTTLTGQNTGGVQLVLTRWSASPAGQWFENVSTGVVATVTYFPNGTVTWTGGGFGTWTASGNTITANGSNGAGTWTDIVTLSADGTTLTGQNTGGISVIESRE